MKHADEQAIDDLIAAFYAGFDNRDGRTPNFTRLRDCFAPSARIVRIDAAGCDHWDLDAFLDSRHALLTNNILTEFHEWEVSSQTVGGGAIASRWSEYEKRGVHHGIAFRGAGRKLIHLYKTAGHWRIASVLWEDIELPDDAATAKALA